MATAQTQCRSVRTNVPNAGACRTVSTAAITVMEANSSRCSAIIYNTSANGMVCRDVSKDGVPTASTGHPIGAGQWLTLSSEGQGRWQCIRAAAADATACTVEALP